MKSRLTLLLILCLLCSQNAVAEQLTVSVVAYNRAEAEGDAADEVYVDYIQKQQTNYKCRLSQGDSAIMRIEGLPESHIGTVTLHMRSNKSSGAGYMQLRIDGQTVWQIADASFASDDWYGAYSDTYVPVPKSLNVSSGTLELMIVATSNSLYFEALTLNFTPVAPMAHTLTLNCGTGARYWLTERAPGAGVVLPEIDEVNDEWTAIGWTDSPISQQHDCPQFYEPGDTFYPSRDTELYALYRSANGVQMLTPDSSCTSGEYILAFGEPFSLAANGAVVNKAVSAALCEMEEDVLITSFAAPSCRYQLTFEGDSVLIHHEVSASWLGHTGANLSSVQSRWKWQHAKAGSICFSFTGSKGEQCLLPKDMSLALFPLSANDPSRFTHAYLYHAESLPEEPHAVVYTSYPLCGVGLSAPNATPSAKKIVRDGRVLIITHLGRIYDLFGREIVE